VHGGVPMTESSRIAYEIGAAGRPVVKGKTPRNLQVVVAVLLGLAAVGAWGLQRFMTGPPRTPATPSPAIATTPQWTEPQLARLHSEIQRQQGAASAKAPSPGGVDLIRPVASIEPDPTRREIDARTTAATESAADRYAEQKDRTLVASSRILALDSARSASTSGRAGTLDLPLALVPGDSVDRAGSDGRSLRSAAGASAATSGASPSPADVASGDEAPGGTRSTLRSTLGRLLPDSHAESAVERPGSPYVVLEGSILPAVLLTQIRSDLPGVLTAQLTDDVYDSLTGRFLLIPRGSRLIGEYGTRVGDTQASVVATFQRIVTPDGRTIRLDRMPAADVSGQAGIQGDVDSHFWKRFGSQFLTAAVVRAVSRGNQGYALIGSSGTLALGDPSSQILVETARGMIPGAGSAGPTITVARGHRFDVMVNRDLDLATALHMARDQGDPHGVGRR